MSINSSASIRIPRTAGRSPAKWTRPAFAAIVPYLYLAPAVLLVGIMLLYPAVSTLVLSFTDWDGLTAPRFIALENYRRLLADPSFVGSLLNTVIWVAATLLLPVAIGLGVAATVNHLRGQRAFKWAFYLPYALSFTTTGVLFVFLLNPADAGGTLNGVLQLTGLDDLAQSWLYKPPLNTFAMIGAYTWLTMGANMMLFLVGLQTIPRDPVEAAQLDGATPWQAFRHVTWPLLQPVAIVVIVMAAVNSFKVFDIIWVMTQGGPYRSSETLAVTMYRESFVSFHMGYGSAIAIVLSIFVLGLSWLYLKRTLPKLD
jgi:ABC-type sugar transport system permease subunit